MAERLRRVPPGLGALLAVSALLAVVWASLTPAFQAPDEHAHFAYVQSLATRFALPGAAGRPEFSTQVNQAMAADNTNIVAGQPRVKPEWSDGVERQFLARQGAAPRDNGGGPGPASGYPPTAYAWEALGYLATSGGTLFDELLGARLMSALWLPITVLATWLLAGEVFGRRRLLQTVAAAVPALLPMVAFITASVNIDGMLFALWTLALWTGVRCLRRGVPLGSAVAFFALVGLACTVKPTSYALLPGAAFVAIVGLVERRPWQTSSLARFAAVVIAPLALTLGAWTVAAHLSDRPAAAGLGAATTSSSGTNWRQFLSYVWQYYLPRTPIQTPFSIPGGGYPALHVWITQGWAAFGWLEVRFAPWVYKVLAALTAAATLLAAVAVTRARRGIDLRVAGFLVLAFVALIAGLHWTDYHQIVGGSAGFMQARYLFPAIALAGLVAAAAVSAFRVAWRGAAAGAIVGGLLVFHLLCLGLVLQRFYA